MNKLKQVQPSPSSNVWILDSYKRGLIVKTIQDDNRYVSITLAKVLKEAGIQELTETELNDFLEHNNQKKVIGRRAEIAK
jgi:hypothetical protein